MKRFLAVMMILTVLMVPVSAWAEAYSFEAVNTFAIKRSADEWMNSPYNRAELTVSLLTEVSIYTSMETDYPRFDSVRALADSYVGVMDGRLVLLAKDQTSDLTIIIVYNPVNGHSACEMANGGDLAAYVGKDFPSAIKNNIDDVVSYALSVYE